MIYDVIVIGGGPSGIFAAIAAKKHGSKVLLIEKNNKLAIKMGISGGGRCNLTNNSATEKIIENIPGNGRFLYSALNQFSNNDTIVFFEQELGVKTKVEDNGRVFPKSDNASTLIEALNKYLINIGVEILYNTEVVELLSTNNQIEGVQLSSGVLTKCNSVILATGGLSYPNTGSTGDGYRMARHLGHQITELFPSSVSLLSDDQLITERLVQGISLKGVELTLYNPQGKKVKIENGDIIFTHFGISGPAALKISRNIYFMQKEYGNDQPFKLSINLFPEKDETELFKMISDLIANNPKKSLLNGFQGFLPEKLLKAIFNKNSLFMDKKMVELNKDDLNYLIAFFKKFTISITGTKLINEAIVTGGGVSLKEINPKTLESKIVKGLFIVGELLDVDAFTGGFNMQVAFSTGFVAGKAASLAI